MAAEFLISTILEKLFSISVEKLLSIGVGKAAEAWKLVADVHKEVKKLTGQFEAIAAVVEAAEQRQVEDPNVKLWLFKLKDVSYDIDDVLDEWNTAILKLEIEKEGTRSVISHFDKRIWVCVSDRFEEERIAIEVLESLVGQNPNLVGWDKILQEISTHVKGKKILLVLDDVWNEDYSTKWEQLKGSLKTSSPASRILVTTRNSVVGEAMERRVHNFFLGKLPEGQCWSLFCGQAFYERTRKERENLAKIGKEIVERCDGIPLAVKVVGRVLRFKKTKVQWQRILDSKMWRIEDVQKHVLSPLLLSYYNLSAVLRQCFSYCAIFPKDYRIGKHDLIRLWMAQGFVQDVEITGEECFNKLATLFFFQDFQTNENGDIISCKMHDMVHNFAQFLTKKIWNDCETIRHSMLTVKMRSLLFHKCPLQDSTSRKDLLNSIDQLKCLRALDLRGAGLSVDSTGIMLTNKVGKLIHLRYLNLSNNDSMRKLPESVCDLYNLQILDITGCTGLTKLPDGIGKLINLVYLENLHTSVTFMPKGMERLTCLRTLSEFVVSCDSTKSKSCGLECLGKLTHLGRHLRIRGLGNVEEGGEAREARLSAKIGLQLLTLLFDSDERRQIRIEDEASVLEGLEPPQTLETLEIRHVRGPTLCPSWMASLTMLKSVTVGGCLNLESLPPMWRLPSLEYLCISGLGKVTKVGEEFFGISSSSSSSSTLIEAFPNLKHLEFETLRNWEEWEYASSSCITIMPRLLSLRISFCPRLKALPGHLLQNAAVDIKISLCPNLEGFTEVRGGE